MKIPILISLLTITTIMQAQNINIGFYETIDSKVLNETRKVIIKLPNDYDNTDKAYPVLYRLDGDEGLFIETAGVLNRLVFTEELMSDMIIVMIENTSRTRDMMPTNTSFFKSEPGADNFKKFIETELISHINKFYRTTDEKILCGQSLSAIFTIYCFLTSPDLFDSYIACSGGFPDCDEYFMNLTKDFIKTKKNTQGKIYITHGVKDFLDPEGVIYNQLLKFTDLINSNENIIVNLKVYDDEGHVPYQSLYHGLSYLYETNRQ